MIWIVGGLLWLALAIGVGWVFGHMARWARGEEIEE